MSPKARPEISALVALVELGQATGVRYMSWQNTNVNGLWPPNIVSTAAQLSAREWLGGAKQVLVSAGRQASSLKAQTYKISATYFKHTSRSDCGSGSGFWWHFSIKLLQLILVIFNVPSGDVSKFWMKKGWKAEVWMPSEAHHSLLPGSLR